MTQFSRPNPHDPTATDTDAEREALDDAERGVRRARSRYQRLVQRRTDIKMRVLS